jgi:predicted nucleic acid-binding protein
MRVALDTNRLTDLFQGDAALAEWLGICDEVWSPLIVLGELKAGFYGSTQQTRNEALLQGLLAKTTVGVLLPSRETAEHYARLRSPITTSGSRHWCWNTISGSSHGIDISSASPVVARLEPGAAILPASRPSVRLDPLESGSAA